MKTLFFTMSFAALLALGACNNETKSDSDRDTVAVTDKSVMDQDGEADINAGDTKVDAVDSWDRVDFDAPEVKIPEVKIKDAGFSVRGNDDYTIYSFEEKLLFDTGKADIRPAAKQNLQQIAASLKQRYPKGKVRIYGHADATDTKAVNKELSEKRAENVKNWLTENTKMDASRISVHPMGESSPVASNQTAKGRQMNRRVEIVGMNDKK
jgi:outer membrane protein OmpA-like peptidoglycan-associated protein